ncbi:MAG: 2-oxo acid dehydrogenase subunit E2, partial [Euzebyales bacterium]|nr:2-oxo acid dehydrogenase subunit E2 [Euzebyales bacterium]
PTTVAAQAGPDVERIPLRGLRRRTAETMTHAWRSIPHTVGFHEVDAAELLSLRRRLKPRAERAGFPLTLTPFLVKASALALVDHPMVNTAFDEAADEIVVHHRRNVGVAVNTDDGLIVPVVRDAERKPLLAIARELAGLASAARDRSIDLAALQGGTFTVTNHGPLGGHFGTSIIKPPEAAIIGFGMAREGPVVLDGEIVVRPILPVSFASDHRIVDGDLSIGFCLTVKALLEDPISLLVEEG